MESPGMLERTFRPDELSAFSDPQSLAGVFAAKEAFMKAMGRKADWLDVWLEKDKQGKPHLHSVTLDPGKKPQVSISHDGDYAVAVVLMP